MNASLPRRAKPSSLSVFRTIQVALLVIFAGAATAVHAASKPPILITNAASTRAVAFESVTMKAEPFSPLSTVQFSTDNRTRIVIFARDLELYAGEGANAFSADAEDGAGKKYLLRVEYVGRVPGFEGITMMVVRLSDDLGNVGDILVRVSLHGMASNRVRVAMGTIGGGPAVDPLTEYSSPAPTTPPPPDPIATPDPFTGPASEADTIRFLEQATFGPPNQAEINRVKAMGFKAYLDEQFALSPVNPAKGSNYPDLPFTVVDDQGTACPTSTGDPNYNQSVCNRDNFSLYPIQRTFYSNALYGQDQLRQRVAFALHQIFVVSGVSPLNRANWMTIYLQSLDRGAFGNYRTLLGEITLNPAMGEYLDMRISTRLSPNENWAREVLQLLSIGVDELNVDGSQKVDAQGAAIPSYSQTTVNEFTKLFTGWNFATAIGAGITNYRDPMVPRSGTNHDVTAKVLLNGVTVPACGAGSQACAQSDLVAGLDNIFAHPNVGPFIGKQLIQHLVTSNPSRAYVERVARVFNNDCDGLYSQGCTGARGNMRAVVQAILLDPEARGDVKTDPNYGKLREPAQYIIGVLRALNVKSFDKSSTSDGVLAGRSTTDFTGSLDQIIFQPTTVFSYYQPGYEVPGTKILGPAFGILSTSTTLKRANNINTLIYTGVASNTSPTALSPDRPRGTSVDLANIEAMASNPGQIADYLNALMLHGTMSTQFRNSIVTAMNAIPTSDANFARKRAQAATYLVATSSQYDIQR
ncbi:MAG TPA: DUF1800 family protein [Pyrinomonadaceae bacterium]|nr:DUF1800 family protein [Pyrinomonadaceae bacterium]